MLEDVWAVHEDTDTRAIDNFIVRLRRNFSTRKEPMCSCSSLLPCSCRGLASRYPPLSSLLRRHEWRAPPAPSTPATAEWHLLRGLIVHRWLNALRLKRAPVSHDVGPVAVDLHPRDRLVQRGPVQH